MRKVIGYALIIAFFCGLFGFTSYHVGVVKSLIVWGTSAAVVALLSLGFYLVFED